MDDNYIGIMSGTSFDGIDAVIVNFNDGQLNIIAQHHHPYSQEIRQSLLSFSSPDKTHRLNDIYSLDAKLGYLYAQTVNELLSQSAFNSANIKAIGCHGQTICHAPNAKPAYTIQMGDPNILAAQTAITTVADFRRRDIAHGGQGAPLAPAFHRYFFHSPDENRAVVNIGGFANITLLPASGTVTGFDTGPGNCFIDANIQKHRNIAFDKYGEWASTGVVHEGLLSRLLMHPFFAKLPPKSTGRDEFHLSWLNKTLADYPNLLPKDIQATITELTAVSIADAITNQDISRVYLCGGGALNQYLLSRIASRLPSVEVKTTQTLGINPQLIEPCLMAWLARHTVNKQPIDLSEITGSSKPAMLGGVYYA